MKKTSTESRDWKSATRLLQAWQEAVEEVIEVAEFNLSALVAQSMQWPFRLSAKQEREVIRDESGLIVGIIQRDKSDHCRERLISQPNACAQGLFKLTVRISNASHAATALPRTATDALAESLVSAHTIMEVRGGEFVSLIDPPESLSRICRVVPKRRNLARPRRRRGRTRHDALLARSFCTTIPQIAPESPGDLFDGAEIDEILSLRIMTMTDEEKREMRQSDDRARQILERTEVYAG